MMTSFFKISLSKQWMNSIFFDEEINNKSIRKILVRNNFATNIILIVFLIFFIISFFSKII